MAQSRPQAMNSFSYVPHVHRQNQDVFIDMQHANHSCESTIEFAEQPWKHCTDHTNCYLGLRFDKREEFKMQMRQLDAKKLKRIEHEEQRIEQTRVNFASYSKKERMMGRLKRARVEWKLEVKAKRQEYIEFIKHQDSARARYPKQWCRNHQLDLDLLARVASWTTDDKPENPALKALAEEEYGFRASAIYFKRSDHGWQPDTHANPHFLPEGKFPNQKIRVHDLLKDVENNPLSEPCEDGRMRYFHFPSNNMRWIEEAMARYYYEDSGDHSDTKGPNKASSKAEKVLSREFWRGQVHGGGGVGGSGVGGGPVHARHMRSRCSLIPIDMASGTYTQRSRTPRASSSNLDALALQPVKGKAKNFAIFLPYLHWETDSRRAKMAQVIKAVTKELEIENDKKLGRVRNPPNIDKTCKHDRRCLPWKKACKDCRKEEERRALAEKESDNDDDELRKAKKRDIYETAKKIKQMKHIKDFKNKKRSKLGSYLMALAQVADAMDYEADERLLRENLHHNPPLHIRRTLDQSYFLTLDDTAVRDKDQVVYRETRAGRSFHTRNTRVVMVDQLWLWILDGNTIITSFPRRWGRNKPDPSGVHKSLRDRLEQTPEEEIQSVYDLALIIIDQCSRVFFDRTKPLDQRPEVMDLFASAIGNVTEHTTIAYESFWRNMEIRAMKSVPSGTIGTTNHKYLDINPEGTLLRESQDVSEELQIMLRIFNQQLYVVRDFRKILGHMNGESKNETDDMRTLIKLLRQNQLVPSDGSNAPLLQEKIVVPESTIQEANDLLELIRNRKAEIQDLEDAALRTTQQLQGLLSLKQQQASIIEAKAALARADESVKQGRAIMAFTLVTIFFLPLGFLAAFFGMNNKQINDAPWMTLDEQMKYMFGLSTAVITISISIAFSPWTRATLTAFVKIPLIFIGEYSGLRALWKYYIVGHGYFEEKNQKRIDWIHGHRNRVDDRHKKKEEERRKVEDEDYLWNRNQGGVHKLVQRFHHGEDEEDARKKGGSKSWPFVRAIEGNGDVALNGGANGNGHVGPGVDIEMGARSSRPGISRSR